MAGRLPGSPKPPGSGRRKGIGREERKLLTDKMAGDLMYVYGKLGGRQFLLKFAQENPAEFLRQGLSRLFPAFPKPEGDADILIQQNNFSGDTTDIARRIAFALSLGLDAQGADPTLDRQPYVALAREEITPQEACRIAPDPQRTEYFERVQQTPEERLASETLDEHCNRRAFADSPPRPAWMPAEERPRPRVGVPRSKRDLI